MFVLLIFSSTVSAQVYFLNQTPDFIKAELYKNSVIEETKEYISKEFVGRQVNAMDVSFGSFIAIRDGNFRSTYYFENGKCFAIKHLFFKDNFNLEKQIAIREQEEKIGLTRKVKENIWRNKLVDVEWFLIINEGEAFTLFSYLP